MLRNKNILGKTHQYILKFLGKLEVYKDEKPHQILGIFRVIKDGNETNLQDDLTYITENFSNLVLQEMTEDEVKIEVI